ncbi:PAS domain-containing sensor histidine kinase [Prolixibacteraceae bacterium Z1-6]|uniref:histidine kinase n=1 Tax=Draconibacterium aestuarii TaxID=2998507 RepID=A0A9X3F4F9_9BACT|nr:PAS domain-containing sensor histidine kinase [Prolixibacteraceae bacterium Z1-6]
MIHLISPDTGNCSICDIMLIAVSVMAVMCSLNGKIICAINSTFSIPVFVYAYYISDFNSHLSPIETVHHSTWWLMAGLLFLYHYSRLETRVILYFFFSLAVLSFQLYKADHLFDSFTYFTPAITNPLLIFTAFFLATFYLRKRLISIIEKLEGQANQNIESINRVLQNSSFLIIKLSAVRDEDGNVVKLNVDKVNNAFESGFKLNLYQIQGQEAGYVFDLIFKGKFDVNKIVFFNKRKVSEYHAANMDKWFKVHVINPSYNLFYLAFEDITQTKKKLAELEASKRRYKVLLEAIPDIFFVIDKDGIYEDFVIKESDLFKIEDANIIGSSIYDAGFPDQMASKIYSCIQHSLKNNSIETIEYSLNTPNGTFLFEMRLAKLNANSVISVARDITKRKTAEFSLEKALARAEESDKLKSAFLANLSHEIRTPMNIITNFTRMLASPDMEGMERLELTDAITQNGLQLMNMIDNTIHLSKIETESISVNQDFCRINPLLRDIYNEFSPNIPDTKDVQMKLNFDVANTEFGFATDNKLLKEALSILVDNAVKYTQRGTVTLGYEMIRTDRIKFVVTDTGIGIPKDDFENIFSRFYRVQNPINQSTSGSGIGLPIAQHYISLLGGELEFESTIDKGSKFWFTLLFKEGRGYMKIVS